MNTFTLRRDPMRLVFSKATWSAAWYLLAYLFTGVALFCIALTAALTGAVLSITLAGLPVLVAAAVTIRWCANVERARLRPLYPVAGRYREVTGSGVMAQLRTRWRDPATWRDVAYLLGMFVPLFALDLTVLTIWLIFLAGITLPVWYRYPHQTFDNGLTGHGVQLGYFPNGPHGHPAWGLYVDTLPKALLAAAISLVLFLLFNYVLVATARVHANVARALLRPPQDPLREAREVLRGPGPLTKTLSPNAP